MAAPTPEAVNDPSRLIPKQPRQSPASGILLHKGGSENAESEEPRCAIKEPRPKCTAHDRHKVGRATEFGIIRVLELLGSETVATVS